MFVLDVPSGEKSIRSCPRCGSAMDEVINFPPTLVEPGLLGHTCPNCNCVVLEPGPMKH